MTDAEFSKHLGKLAHELNQYQHISPNTAYNLVCQFLWDSNLIDPDDKTKRIIMDAIEDNEFYPSILDGK